MSVDWSYLPCCLYFIFKDVTPIVGSCWSRYVSPIVRCVPSNFGPAHKVVVELNWVILRWSCGDIDKIPCASVDCSPPCCFEIYEGYVLFSSLFDVVGCEDPMFSGGNVRHGESLVLMLRCH